MKNNRVKMNFIYNIAYQVLVLILPLITAPYLSRVISGDGIGIYSYTQAFSNYFVLIAMLGIESYGNREIARVRDDKEKKEKTFWSIFVIQFFLTVVLSVIYVMYVIISDLQYKTIYLLQLFYVISAGFNINWYFFGMEKFKITVTRNMVIKIITTIAIFMFVKKPTDLWLYTLIISLGTFISTIVVWPFLLKEISFRRITWFSVKLHIKPNLTLFIPVLAVSLYNVMDKIMLGSMSTYSEVAYYTYAEKIIQVPVTVIIALGTVMMPHITNLISNGREEECKLLFDKAMLFVIFLSTAFTFGMANLAPVFSDWYYGNDFARCGLFMVYLSPVIVFKSWANLVRTQYIIPNGYDFIYILSVSMGAITNLCINALMIPKFQGIGAIIGTISAEFIVCFIQIWKTRKSIQFKLHLVDGLSFFVIGTLMYSIMQFVGVHLLVNSNFFNMLLRFTVGTVFYIIASMCFLLGIKKDERVVKILENYTTKGLKSL